MAELMLLLCKPFVFLGPSDFRGSFALACLRNLFRMIVLFASSFLLTCTLVSWDFFQPPSRDGVVERFGEIQARLRDPAFVKSLIATSGIDPSSVTFEVSPIGAGDEQSYTMAIEQGGTITELGVVHKVGLYPDPKKNWAVAVLLDGIGFWPFREQLFTATPFITSTVLLSSDAASEISAQEKQAAKARLDRILADAPSAKSSDFAWPRRLSGPIQFACYFLFFIGSILLLLHWLANVVPNLILRSAESISVQRARTGPLDLASSLTPMEQEATARDAVVVGDTAGGMPASNPAIAARQAEAEEPRAAASAPATASTQRAAQQVRSYERADVITPWSGRAEGDLDRMITTLEEIRTSVQQRAGWLLARPVFPLLDIRITGLKAMKTARSGENVPSFVAVETDAAAERLEAQHRFSAFTIWAIPTLGFIGTVVGIGDALLSTVALQSAYEIVRTTAESSIGLSIGVAFDTTFVALVLSFLLMLLLHFVQDAEDKMLAREKRSALQDLLQVENLRPGNDIQDFAQTLAAWGLSIAQITKWFDSLQVDRHGLEVALNNFTNQNLSSPRVATRSGLSWVGRAAIVVVIGVVVALNWEWIAKMF